MKFGHIKNLFTSTYDKFRIIDSVLNGDIDISDIKILTLYGYTGYRYPDEEYLYIGYKFDRKDGISYISTNNGEIKVVKRNIGYWRSGTVIMKSLIIKNSEMLLEYKIK